MKQVQVKAEGYFKISYDPNSPEFKQTLEDYRELMDKDATEEDVIKNVAHQLRLAHAERMLEGIGYVKCRGRIMGSPYSGIEVEDDDPSFEYEIED